MGVQKKKNNFEYADLNWWINLDSGNIQIHPKLPLEKLYFKSHGSGTIGKTWQDHPSNWQLCKVWKTISPIVDATNISFDKKYPKNRRETPNLNMPLCKPELASLYA